MFKALYDYGRAHPECVLLPGMDMKGMKYTVDIGADGRMLGISEFGKDPVRRPYLALTGKTRKASPFAEKAWIAIHMDEGANGNVDERRGCFLGYFEECAAASPEAAAVLQALRSDGFYDEAIRMAEAAGVKPDDCIGFRYDGRLLTDYGPVCEWWTGYYQEHEAKSTDGLMLDLMTGEPCHAAVVSGKKLSPMELPGAQSSGSVVVTFDKPAFASYGLEQNANAPMSAETLSYAMDALAHLCRKGNRLGDVRYVHWYSGRESEPEADLFDDGFFAGQGSSQDDEDSVDADEAEESASRLVRSPLDGIVPASLDGYEYHILALSAQGGRAAVLSYMKGSYEELYGNFRKWFDGLALTDASGMSTLRYKPFYKMGGTLLLKGDKWKAVDRTMAYAMRACVDGGRLPRQVLQRALARFLSDLLDSGLQEKNRNINFRAAAWIKLYLAREAESRKEGFNIMEYLNKEHPNPAYHCGRIMAVYAAIQANAKDVNTGVLERYYTSCSRSPAMVLGTLQSMANHWLDDLKYQNKKNILEDALGQAYGAIDTHLPKKLSLEDRGYFALGYVQQTAALNREFKLLASQRGKRGGSDDAADEDD